MKKVCLLLCLALAFCFFVGCEEVESVTVVSLRPIDAEMIPAHEELKPHYTYKYDRWNDEYRMMPEIKTVWREKEYRVKYEETSSDGSVKCYWDTVEKEEYEAAVKQIEVEETVEAESI